MEKCHGLDTRQLECSVGGGANSARLFHQLGTSGLLSPPGFLIRVNALHKYIIDWLMRLRVDNATLHLWRGALDWRFAAGQYRGPNNQTFFCSVECRHA